MGDDLASTSVVCLIYGCMQKCNPHSICYTKKRAKPTTLWSKECRKATHLIIDDEGKLILKYL